MGRVRVGVLISVLGLLFIYIPSHILGASGDQTKCPDFYTLSHFLMQNCGEGGSISPSPAPDVMEIRGGCAGSCPSSLLQYVP